jgi:predicted metal-dependent hydrolase
MTRNWGRMALDWTDKAMAQGLACYRAGEFFEAHEHWEAVWLRSTEPDKTFLQSLIQVSAAFHHLRRRNLHGTASLLRRSLAKLDRYPDLYAGIDVARLRGEMSAWIESISEGAVQPDRCPLIL